MDESQENAPSAARHPHAQGFVSASRSAQAQAKQTEDTTHNSGGALRAPPQAAATAAAEAAAPAAATAGTAAPAATALLVNGASASTAGVHQAESSTPASDSSRQHQPIARFSKEHMTAGSKKAGHAAFKLFDEKIKSLAIPDSWSRATRNLAHDLAKQLDVLKELKSIIRTLEEKKSVPKSVRLHHTLNLPDRHKNNTRLQELSKEMNERARTYESEQTNSIVESKKCILQLEQDGLKEKFFYGAFSVCSTVTCTVLSAYRTELLLSKEDMDDLPDDKELPLSSFAFCALYQVLKDDKPTYLKYLESNSIEILLKELSELASNISRGDPIAMQVPSSLLQKHSKYEAIFEQILESASKLIAAASFELQADHIRFLAAQQTEAKNWAKLQGQTQRSVTFATNEAVERENLRSGSNLEKFVADAVQKELSKSQRKRQRNKERKPTAAAASAKKSGNEQGGRKLPQSDPRPGKKQQGRDQASTAKSKKRKAKGKSSDTTPRKREPSEKPDSDNRRKRRKRNLGQGGANSGGKGKGKNAGSG